MIKVEYRPNERLIITRDGTVIWETEAYEVHCDMDKFIALFTGEKVVVEIEEEV